MCACFFNETATTEIYTYLHTLSLHDALPISAPGIGTRGARGESDPAPSGEFERVGEQVECDLAQARGIAHHAQGATLQVDHEIDPLRPRLFLPHPRDIAQFRAHIHRGVLDRHFAGFDLGDIEDKSEERSGGKGGL